MRAWLICLLLLQGCAYRREAGFAWQRLSGDPAVAECAKDGAASVCRWRPKGAAEDLDGVLFFLHYATGDEKSLARVGLLNSFYKRYRKAGLKPPRVVSVSYGPHWLVSNEPGQRQIVLRRDFEDLLERLQGGPVKQRYLWGLSMGGYNAAEEAFFGSGWSAVMLSCPALLTDDPFGPEPPSLSAKQKDGRTLFNIRLRDSGAWKRENPLALAQTARPAPAIGIEANKDDEFGFFPGAAALAQSLRAAGKPVEFHALPGGHCAVDGAAAAEFFLSLDERSRISYTPQ